MPRLDRGIQSQIVARKTGLPAQARRLQREGRKAAPDMTSIEPDRNGVGRDIGSGPMPDYIYEATQKRRDAMRYGTLRENPLALSDFYMAV
jgi:hypothetical protein